MNQLPRASLDTVADPPELVTANPTPIGDGSRSSASRKDCFGKLRR
jgi:hypothetical protein